MSPVKVIWFSVTLSSLCFLTSFVDAEQKVKTKGSVWNHMQLKTYADTKRIVNIFWVITCPENEFSCEAEIRKNSPTGKLLYKGETGQIDANPLKEVSLGSHQAIEFISSSPMAHNYEETILMFDKKGEAHSLHQYQGRSTEASDPVMMDDNNFRIDASTGSGFLQTNLGGGPQMLFGIFIRFVGDDIKIEYLLNPQHNESNWSDQIKKDKVTFIKDDSLWASFYCNSQLAEIASYLPEDTSSSQEPLSELDKTDIYQLKNLLERFEKVCPRPAEGA